MSAYVAFPTPRVIHGLTGLQELLGQEVGVSDWYEVSQPAVDAFAQATGDLNPMHVDPAHGAGTVFGTTIAHGLYTLSLGPRFNYALFEVRDLGVALNYGYDRVRFPAPLPIPSRVRMRLVLDAVQASSSGVQATFTQIFEREKAARPVCVATFLLYFVGSSGPV
jgi:acyl dehydratase